MEDNRLYISQVTLPNDNNIYHIKDAVARELIGQLQGVTFHKCVELKSGDEGYSTYGAGGDTPYGVVWSYTASETTISITGTLPASAATKSYVYLVPSNYRVGSSADIYDEYITVQTGTETINNVETPIWIWEKLGDTEIDFDSLGDMAYADQAKGSTTLSTVDSATYKNGTASVSASYTPAGSVSVTLGQTGTAATLTTGNYTPAGSVSKPTITITDKTEDVYGRDSAGSVTAGSAASFTSGSFDGGSFTQGQDQFTAPTLVMDVSNEVLSISFSAGSFSQGSDSFTAATHGSDTFTANTPTAVTLPTFKKQTVLKSGTTAALDAAPTFTGTEAENILVTGVTYDKASVSAASFSGTQATISSTGTSAGTVELTSSSKTITITSNPLTPSNP